MVGEGLMWRSWGLWSVSNVARQVLAVGSGTSAQFCPQLRLCKVVFLSRYPGQRTTYLVARSASWSLQCHGGAVSSHLPDGFGWSVMGWGCILGARMRRNTDWITRSAGYEVEGEREKPVRVSMLIRFKRTDRVLQNYGKYCNQMIK